LTSVAGLLAGAFSMGAGEFISMLSQREMFEYQIAQERDELQRYPAEEAEELALIYAARGIPIEEARDIAAHLIANPEKALDTLAREELGWNPDDLGSPIGAALSSFVAFVIGASMPLIPFLLAAGNRASSSPPPFPLQRSSSSARCSASSPERAHGGAACACLLSARPRRQRPMASDRCSTWPRAEATDCPRA
jgi:hypothetical protein